MERECLLEGDVEVMVGSVVVRCVQAISEVAADHKHTYIHTQSDTCAKRQIA